MNRKVIAAAVAVLVVGVLVWVFALRGDGSHGAGKGDKGGPGGAGFKAPHGAGRTGEVPLDPSRPSAWDVDPPGSNELEGQVLDDHDDPVKGAEVVLSSVPERTAKTNDDGSFTFDKLVNKEYGVTARAGDMVGGPVMRWATGQAEPVIIRLRKGAGLNVHVVADGDGAPISGAQVSLRSESRSETTGADGVATLHGVR